MCNFMYISKCLFFLYKYLGMVLLSYMFKCLSYMFLNVIFNERLYYFIFLYVFVIVKIIEKVVENV